MSRGLGDVYKRQTLVSAAIALIQPTPITIAITTNTFFMILIFLIQQSFITNTLNVIQFVCQTDAMIACVLIIK